MFISLTRSRRILPVVAVLIALAASASAQQTAPIAIGPYIQNVSDTSATICWATRDGQVTITAPDIEPQAVRAYNHHSVLLRRLTPATTYDYSVLGDVTADKVTFTTFPKDEQPLTFAVVGDTRSRHDVHRRIVEGIIAQKPALVLNTGDLVSDGRDIAGWETFFKTSGDLMRTVPYYPVLGNHENDAKFYFDFFALPGNERYYSFNRGPVHFIGLDTVGPRMPESNQPVTESQQQAFEQDQQRYWQRQMEWLRDDLAAQNDAKYIFVFFHHPLYTVKASRVEGTNEVRDRFGTVFQDNRVSAVFTGHDHYYHRAVAGGIPFVTTGGGGAPLYDTDAPQPETVKYAKVEHFVRIDVGLDKAAARVIDINGATIDEFEMRARAPASPN